jgi:hypothetical protein
MVTMSHHAPYFKETLSNLSPLVPAECQSRDAPTYVQPAGMSDRSPQKDAGGLARPESGLLRCVAQ